MAAQPPRTPGARGEPVTMTYQDLRRMAEAAGSHRGSPFWIVVDENGWRIETSPTVDPEAAVIPCMNPHTERPEVSHAELGTPGVKAADLLNLKDPDGNPLGPADAVFWSAAAVEKFVVPYYASVYGDHAGVKVQEVISVLGTNRLPPPNVDEEAFGLAHLPKSEYVQVGMGVLVNTEAGVRVFSISDYLERQG